MTKISRISLFLVVGIFGLVFFSNSVFAQSKKFTLSVKEASLGDFIDKIESQSDFFFYYDQESTATVKISIDAVDVTIEQLLERSLLPQNLYFFLGKNKAIYITKNKIEVSESVQSDSSQIIQSLPSLISIENQLFTFGDKATSTNEKKSISGIVRHAETGVPLQNVTVTILGSNTSTPTNHLGAYNISTNSERLVLVFSGLGLQETRRQILLYKSGQMNVDLNTQAFELSEFTVISERADAVTRTEMGVQKLDIKTIKMMPSLLGEADILRAALSIPGVQSAGEAASGFSVRGGAPDQNLIIYNGATIYNPSHLFGLFSTFNPDAVEKIELYKSSIPAKYGGRAASVLEVTPKKGTNSKLSGSGGIGLATGRLLLEGPIGKKTTFLIAGRSTYSDWLLGMIPDKTLNNSTANFYDGQFLLNHRLNEYNDISLTGYFSSDFFQLNNEAKDEIHYGYGNRNGNIRWRNTKYDRIVIETTIGTDNYRFNLSEVKNPLNDYRFRYNLGQDFIKTDFTHKVSQKHDLNYGLQINRYRLLPGEISPQNIESLVVKRSLEKEQAYESSVYFSDYFKVQDKLALDLGVRFSLYNFVGPKVVNSYLDGVSKSPTTITNKEQFEKGDLIKTYAGPELRLGLRYLLKSNSSLKLSYNSLRQYIHMLSNTTAITPTDSWKLSDSYIKPQFSDQISAGYYFTEKDRNYEFSVEAYYKRIKNYLDYKSGAKLLMNEAIETDVIGTQARAYGAEMQLKKNTGRLSGWLSYTYARIQQRTTGTQASEMINGGQYFSGNFDRPHTLNAVFNYRVSHRFFFSTTGAYSTGRPITIPVGLYTYEGSERMLYTNRNEFRAPDFFRLDLSANIEGNHKVKKLAHSSWSIGVYNLTGRKNPFSIYFLSENGKINGYKLSIFGTPIPFITYNFKF